MIIQALIVVLSLAGLVLSSYFTLAYYGRIRKARWVPEILCAREGSSCVTVVQTPYARVFGVPNSILGILYYFALIAWTLRPDAWLAVNDWTTPRARAAWWLFLSVSASTVALGFYLVYALRRILHIDCPLCYTAHAINLAILVLLCFLSW
ncbi:MAG: hypothetical protein HY508_09525 [Acidobacteria bacterium]|nr:hypothetical protein [Acidobacteriota bacterium]